MSISRRGMLAAGLTAAVVGSIGVVSIINASADENTDSPAAATASATADGADGTATADQPEFLTPPDALLPWGARPHKMKLARTGASSAAIAAAGASAAKDDNAVQPDDDFAPKGLTSADGDITTQTTNVEPPPAPPTPPSLRGLHNGMVRSEPTGSNEVVYHYGNASQDVATGGASASITIARPKVQAGDWHSLAEIAVQIGNEQMVEVGWTVDRSVNKDDDPHLFVYHWVNGSPTCYNGCGFVPAKGASIKPGDPLTTGVSKNFAIQHLEDAWWIAYDSEWIGAFPDSEWKDVDGGFTAGSTVQFFGEIASPKDQSCTQMGNGNPFADAAAARFSLVQVISPDPNVKADLKLVTTDFGNPDVVQMAKDMATQPYQSRHYTSRTFMYGGSPLGSLLAPKC